MDTSHMLLYEAPFCCTMKLAEGLLYIKENHTCSNGYLIYVEVKGVGEAYVTQFSEVDGHKLSPILKYYDLPDDVVQDIKQKVVLI